MSLTARIKRLLKQSDLLFSWKYRHDFKEYRENLGLMKSCRVKTQAEIAAEMADLRNYWHCRPDHYVRYGLFDKKLSREELRDYIPPYIFYAKFLLEEYKKFPIERFNNKSFLYDFFTERGIPTPPVLARGRIDHLTTPDGQAVTLKDIIDTELTAEAEKLFIKPCGGSGGNGIVVLSRRGGELCRGREKTSIAELLTGGAFGNAEFVIQKGLKQRGDISMIAPNSINTLRIVTRKEGDGISMPICIMRIGRNSSDVDNSAQGGLSVVIDTRTGAFAEHAFAEHGGGLFEKHPDTGFVFAGKRIEGWDAIRAKVIEFAGRLADLPIFAWDVALTVDGPCIIEINFNFGIDHIQCCAGGMRRRFHIGPNGENVFEDSHE